MANSRVERLNSQILKVLSSAVLKLNDPQFNTLITFTKAQISPNVEFCKVYVSIMDTNDNNKEEMLTKLKKATGFFKKEIGSTLKLRVIPDIKFVLDDGLDYSKKIEDILKSLNIPKEGESDEI